MTVRATLAEGAPWSRAMPRRNASIRDVVHSLTRSSPTPPRTLQTCRSTVIRYRFTVLAARPRASTSASHRRATSRTRVSGVTSPAGGAVRARRRASRARRARSLEDARASTLRVTPSTSRTLAIARNTPGATSLGSLMRPQVPTANGGRGMVSPPRPRRRPHFRPSRSGWGHRRPECPSWRGPRVRRTHPRCGGTAPRLQRC